MRRSRIGAPPRSSPAPHRILRTFTAPCARSARARDSGVERLFGRGNEKPPHGRGTSCQPPHGRNLPLLVFGDAKQISSRRSRSLVWTNEIQVLSRAGGGRVLLRRMAGASRPFQDSSAACRSGTQAWLSLNPSQAAAPSPGQPRDRDRPFPPNAATPSMLALQVGRRSRSATPLSVERLRGGSLCEQSAELSAVRTRRGLAARS
jgi:hypothetical protein